MERWGWRKRISGGEWGGGGGDGREVWLSHTIKKKGERGRYVVVEMGVLDYGGVRRAVVEMRGDDGGNGWSGCITSGRGLRLGVYHQEVIFQSR